MSPSFLEIDDIIFYFHVDSWRKNGCWLNKAEVVVTINKVLSVVTNTGAEGIIATCDVEMVISIIKALKSHNGRNHHSKVCPIDESLLYIHLAEVLTWKSLPFFSTVPTVLFTVMQ